METVKKALEGRTIKKVIVIDKNTVCLKFEEKKTKSVVKRKKAGDIQILRYSERSILVVGDTKHLKEVMKENYGKWNKYLGGWIFSIKRLTTVEKIVGSEMIPQTNF